MKETPSPMGLVEHETGHQLETPSSDAVVEVAHSGGGVITYELRWPQAGHLRGWRIRLEIAEIGGRTAVKSSRTFHVAFEQPLLVDKVEPSERVPPEVGKSSRWEANEVPYKEILSHASTQLLSPTNSPIPGNLPKSRRSISDLFLASFAFNCHSLADESTGYYSQSVIAYYSENDPSEHLTKNNVADYVRYAKKRGLVHNRKGLPRLTQKGIDLLADHWASELSSSIPNEPRIEYGLPEVPEVRSPSTSKGWPIWFDLLDRADRERSRREREERQAAGTFWYEDATLSGDPLAREPRTEEE